VFRLTGQEVLSEIDAAIYADVGDSLPDETFEIEFYDPFNESYLGGLDPRAHTISHGALYEGLTNKPDVLAKLSKIPGRVETLEAGSVAVFANLPEAGMVGFQGFMSYKEAVRLYAQPWDWY
jgi:hypothetical protein